MVNLVVNCLRSETSLDQLKNIWKTLERVDAQCTPFSSWVWADNWWREFGVDSGKLRILIVKNGQEIVAICPLYIQTTRHYRILPLTTLALIGAIPGLQGTHPGVLAHPRYRQSSEMAILQYLPKLKEWDTLVLDGIDTHSNFVELARKRLQTGRGVVASEVKISIRQKRLPQSVREYRLSGDGQRPIVFDRLYSKIDSTSLVSHSDPSLDSAPSPYVSDSPDSAVYDLSICSTRQSLNESRDVLNALKQQNSGRGARQKSQSTSLAQERFHKSVVSDFFVADLLWQLTLKVDQRVVAVQHYFIWHGDLLLFDDAYSPELEPVDTARFMMAYAIEKGIGYAFRQLGIHSLSFDYGNLLVGESTLVSQLRFTPSMIPRVVEKMLETLKKA